MADPLRISNDTRNSAGREEMTCSVLLHPATRVAFAIESALESRNAATPVGDKKDQRHDDVHGIKAPPPPGKQAPERDLVPANADQLASQREIYRPLDRKAEADRLRAAFVAHDQEKIVAVLEDNSGADAMYALRRSYGESFSYDLQQRLDESHFARARGFAGDQIELSKVLSVRSANDSEPILRDLERVSDQQAWELIMTPGKDQIIEDDGKEGPQPPSSTLEEVQAVLREKLNADEYYRAMRLILKKADRFVAAHANEARFAGFTANESIVTPGSDVQVIAMALARKNPALSIRVDLAEARIRAADGAAQGSKAEVDAFLALADLNSDERQMLALRLRDKPLKDNQIDETRLNYDDAQVVHMAIEASWYRASLAKQTIKGIGLEVALERAGQLIRAARDKVNDPSLKPAEREPARKELQRLEEMFYGEKSEGIAIATALRSASADEGEYKEQLEDLGAGPVTVGAKLLANVSISDTRFDSLIEVLKGIPAEHRRAAMQRAGKIDDLPYLTAEHREIVNAYLDVGAPLMPVAGFDGAVAGQPLDVIPLTFVPPEVTLALVDIVPNIARGPVAAHLVLARLQRLPYALRKLLFAQPKYRAAIDAMPKGDEKSPERDFKDAMARAEISDIGPDLAIAGYPGGPDSGQEIALEDIRIKADKYGRDTLRRGYVLDQQIGPNDDRKLNTLSPSDRVAVQQFREVERIKASPTMTAQADTATDVMFGAVQLAPDPSSSFDPTMEARFMNLRLHKAAALDESAPLSSWKGGPDALEALSQFQSLYANERPGGVSRTALALLAETYYRALREIVKWHKKVQENETLASIAATVAGVVVSVGIGLLTGGTALPLLAAAALSGTAAGTAAAVAGIAVRMHSTGSTITKDFGMGVVDGITAIAGAGLAAKIVRGSAAGLGAGKAAAEIGAHVASEAAGHAGGAAAIAEAAIDGAFSGAAGELFQTATDEATWDRGVGEALAKMLSAIIRGGGMGAVAGGVLSSGVALLARKAGPQVAAGLDNLLEHTKLTTELVNHWTAKAQEDLVEITRLIESGKADEAEKMIQSLVGVTSKQRELLTAYARGWSALRTAGDDAIQLEGKFELPRFKDDAAFNKVAKNSKAHAVVIIEDGKPVIYARIGTPKSAILEEVVHLRQWQTSAVMRSRMQNLSEESLARWPQMGAEEKLAAHIDKLEVEADAQRTIVEQFAGKEDDEEAIIRMHDAQDTLQHVQERLDTLHAARPPFDLGKLDIEKQPRLYGLGHQTERAAQEPKGKIARWIKKGESAEAKEGELKELGYHLSRTKDGTVFRITRDKSGLAPLSIEDGKIVKAKATPTFGEQKEAAAEAWRAEERGLELLERKLGAGEASSAEKAQLKAGGAGAKGILRSMVGNGIDEATAGLMSKWAPALDKIESDFGISAREILNHHIEVSPGAKKAITLDELSSFRKEVRTTVADGVIAKPGRQRREALDRWLELQPDEASKGALFDAYADRAIAKQEIDGEAVFANVAGGDPATFKGTGLKNPRTPDSVGEIKTAAEGYFAKGRYAFEYKTGEHALDLSQAEDYAKRAFKPGDAKSGGFKLTPQAEDVTYEGVIYVFSSRAEAKAAHIQMKSNTRIEPVLGKEPGGIHIMYVDSLGGVTKWKV